MPLFRSHTFCDLRNLTFLFPVLALAACDISSSDLDRLAANTRGEQQVNPDNRAEYARLGQIAFSNYSYNRANHRTDWTGYSRRDGAGTWGQVLYDLRGRHWRIREAGAEGYRHRQQLLFENEIVPHFASGGENFIARYCFEVNRFNQTLCGRFGYQRFTAIRNERRDVQDLTENLVQYERCMRSGEAWADFSRRGRVSGRLITGLEPVECREAYYDPVSWGRAFDIVDNSEYKEQLCRQLQIESLPICRWRH
jgi:hypothetical protein